VKPDILKSEYIGGGGECTNTNAFKNDGMRIKTHRNTPPQKERKKGRRKKNHHHLIALGSTKKKKKNNS